MKVYERRCVVCGRLESEAGILSRRGLCEADSKMLMELNNDQMRDGRGPFYEHWARRRFMAARRRLVAIERGEA